jgi:hypothetical protein
MTYIIISSCRYTNYFLLFRAEESSDVFRLALLPVSLLAKFSMERLSPEKSRFFVLKMYFPEVKKGYQGAL